jgi:hypothetical protein
MLFPDFEHQISHIIVFTTDLINHLTLSCHFFTQLSHPFLQLPIPFQQLIDLLLRIAPSLYLFIPTRRKNSRTRLHLLLHDQFDRLRNILLRLKRGR